MAMQKIYKRINWENLPSEKTPLDEINLNKMDKAIDDLDDRMIEQSYLSSGVKLQLAYVIGNVPYEDNWLSDKEGGAPLIPDANKIYVVMTDGSYSRLLFIFNGTKYIQVGAKLNVSPAIPDIPHTNMNPLSKGSGSSSVVSMRFRPADTTTKIIVKFNWSAGSYGGGGSFGVENVEMKTYNRTGAYGAFPTGNVSYTFNLSVGEKENDFVFRVGGTGSYSSTTINSYSITEVSDENIYRQVFQQKNRIVDHMPGLVPAPNDEVGNTGVLMSDGKWHTLDELKEMLGIESQP